MPIGYYFWLIPPRGGHEFQRESLRALRKVKRQPPRLSARVFSSRPRDKQEEACSMFLALVNFLREAVNY